jgi:hypothetical protein
VVAEIRRRHSKVSIVLCSEKPDAARFKLRLADNAHESTAWPRQRCGDVNGEPVDVETTNQSTGARETLDGAGCATQPMARGVDCQQRCMLSRRDGSAGHPVFIERGAGVAAQTLLDERQMPLLVSAPRRPSRIVATYPGPLEPGACRLQRRGTSAAARQTEHRPEVRCSRLAASSYIAGTRQHGGQLGRSGSGFAGL